MVGERRVIAVLGDVVVEVRTSRDQAGQALLDYLGEFYRLEPAQADTSAWRVDARLGKPGSEFQLNPFGVGYLANEQQQTLTLRAAALFDLQVTTRKCVREVFLDACEQARYVMLHASAIADPEGGRVVIFVGDKRAGKTTLALGAVVEHGWSLLSNDHLIVFAHDTGDLDGQDGGPLVVTSVPTLIPVKVGTLLDLEDALPEPWDSQGVDVADYRHMPAQQRYTFDARVLYTYRRLGQDNPLLTVLDDATETTIVLPSYADVEEPPEALRRVEDPEVALGAHLRTDWHADPRLNQQHLPRRQRTPAQFASDGTLMVAALSRRAPVVSWRHHGEFAPLVTFLDTLTTPRRVG